MQRNAVGYISCKSVMEFATVVGTAYRQSVLAVARGCWYNEVLGKLAQHIKRFGSYPDSLPVNKEFPPEHHSDCVLIRSSLSYPIVYDL